MSRSVKRNMSNKKKDIEKFPVQTEMSESFLSKIFERSNGGLFMLYFNKDGEVRKFVKGKSQVYESAIEREIDKYIKDRDSSSQESFSFVLGEDSDI